MPITKTDKKRDGLQGYRVRVNYTDASGNYRQIERIAYGKAAAQEMERKLSREVGELDASNGSRMTVIELCEDYLTYKKHEVRTTTFEKTKSILSRSVLPTLGGYRLNALNSATLTKWQNALNEGTLSVRTKKNAYGELRAMLNYAVRMEYIPRNPLATVPNFREVYFEVPQDKLHYYTPEQFRAFIRAAEAHTKTVYDWGIYVFFCIAYYTGMRKGEINALKWSDIEGDIIYVRRSVAQKVKGHSIVETPPKNKSSYRSLQAPKPLMEILQQHKQRQQKDPRWTEDYRVCGGIACISDTALSNHNIAFANAAGLPHIRIHDFRHSHASLLANEGINIQEVARRLGHSDVQQTWQTYAHLYPREQERAVAILDKITLDAPEKTPKKIDDKN